MRRYNSKEDILCKCRTIRDAVKSGIGEPEISKDNMCSGYCRSETDDEPLDICKVCPNSPYEDE